MEEIFEEVPADGLALLLELREEVAEGVSLYWEEAVRVLDGGEVRLKPLQVQDLDLRRHFFSALFLYSYRRLGLVSSRRVLYAAVNQCLRGMVTGCDNLLDDEYKPTLHTDLPEQSIRFRSVLDIMVSDRVLFALLFSHQEAGFSRDKVLEAGKASLRGLLQSGVQEAVEEGGVRHLPPPERVLSHVHHFKTGLLFQSPWAVPLVFESPDRELLEPVLDGLYHIGMGCQILDDMVDLGRDLRDRRHNYLLSLIEHGSRGEERQRLEALRHESVISVPQDMALLFPFALDDAVDKARDLLDKGLELLLEPGHLHLSPAMSRVLARLIGASLLLQSGSAR